MQRGCPQKSTPINCRVPFLLELAEVALTQPKLPALEAARDHRRSAQGSTQGSGGLPPVPVAAAELRRHLIPARDSFSSSNSRCGKKLAKNFQHLG